MKTFNRLFTITWLAGGIALMSGCADSMTQPQQPDGLRDEVPVLMDSFAFDTKSGMDVVDRYTPLRFGQGVKKMVEREDDTWFHLPDANIHVLIPEGALPQEEMAIALEAYSGTAVAWEFYPHGTQFNKPIRIYIDVLGTELDYLQDSMPSMKLSDAIGVYWKGDAASAWPVQFFNAHFVNNPTGSDQIWFETDHFSGYALAM